MLNKLDGYLTKVDRMSMANSIETRAPFLDYRLIEFMVGVDKNIKVENFKTKSILRNTIAKNFPSSILKSKKMGFVAPLDNWLNNESAKNIMENLTISNWNLNNDFIKKLILENKKNVNNNGLFLWQLLILKKFNE